MLNQILTHFTPHTHPLTLAHDPDHLLAEEQLLTALAGRGFTLLHHHAGADPLALRRAVQPLRPFRAARPVIIITPQPLNQLPYDLWQQGQPVQLALHAFFPHYAYPLLQQLSAEQRWRLSQVPPPALRLGRQASLDAILSAVFNVTPDIYRQPAALLRWLTWLHQQPDPLPPLFRAEVQQRLQAQPHTAGWPLAALLVDAVALRDFVNRQWQAAVQRRSGQPLAENGAVYRLPFEQDETLQDALPHLLRSGALEPVAVEQVEPLPGWMRVAVVSDAAERPLRRFEALLARLGEVAAPPVNLAGARWAAWQGIAHLWAELTALYYDPVLSERLPPAVGHSYRRWQAELDGRFAAWLQRSYAPLGGQQLPTPHHLFHTPTLLNHRHKPADSGAKVALLILDGLSLADWKVVQPLWQARQPGWHFNEQLLLAQIPAITAVSRQALVSGLRPADFAATLTHNRAERRLWLQFWERAGLSGAACAYHHLSARSDDALSAIQSARLQAICLVVSDIDNTVHHASLGQVEQQASLKVWLQENSRLIETALDDLLRRGFAVYLASDHGHTQARGMGQPSEGALVETRSKRARLYRDRLAAAAMQPGFDAVLWGQDGLLPEDVWALLAPGRQAFATLDQIVVSHGGLTLDEMVAPLVQISKG